jgi:putative ABC transport system permease protein
VRDVVVFASALNNLLVFLVIVLLMVTLVGLRRKRYALLRALGASRTYILVVIWCGCAALLVTGCVVGSVLGWVGAIWVAVAIEQRTGLRIPVWFGSEEALLVIVLAVVGSILAAIPAVMAWRTPPAEALRG